MTHNASKKSKILCVDDEANVLASLQRTLRRRHHVDTALSGEEALCKLADSHDYKVIVSDYNMPNMDGIAFLKQVRNTTPNVIQIMLTGKAELEMAIQTVNETDIFRFLAKPCEPLILRKAIDDGIEYYDLIESQKQLTRELEQANTLLSKQKAALEQEKQLANSILINIGNRHASNLTGLNWQIRPMEQVGGDLVLSYLHPSGVLHAMLGDITGHGLPAALAALSTADAFEMLSINNLNVADIAQGINEKLNQTLPTGIFCAAMLIRYDIYHQQIDIWHGGLPDGVLINRQQNSFTPIRSDNLPLGVLAGQNYTTSTHSFSSNDFDSLFICTDGATEQVNEQNEMFGDARLTPLLSPPPSDTSLIESITRHIDMFRGDAAQSDDLSMLELDFKQLSQALQTNNNI